MINMKKSMLIVALCAIGIIVVKAGDIVKCQTEACTGQCYVSPANNGPILGPGVCLQGAYPNYYDCLCYIP
jgi:hypothetical protein